VVQQDATAPLKPNVLAQTSTDATDYRSPLAILDEGGFQDVAVSVKFKAVVGKVDQAGGIVFRLQDPNNYYILRANALEDNYRLYHRRPGDCAAAMKARPHRIWHPFPIPVGCAP